MTASAVFTRRALFRIRAARARLFSVFNNIENRETYQPKDNNAYNYISHKAPSSFICRALHKEPSSVHMVFLTADRVKLQVL